MAKSINMITVFAGLALVLGGFACSTLPDEPEFDNPIIPDDPNFTPPQTTILSGPVEGAVVDSHAVSFTWAGNQDGMAFAIRLNEGSWSDWTTDTTTTFQYLDEGDHLFELRGQYTSGVIEDTAATRSFTIDDIHGPALWLYPRYQQVDVGSEFSVEVMLEEVENVFAVKAVLDFDPAKLQVSQVEVYEDSRSLLKLNGGTVIPFSSSDNTLGIATIEIATATADPPGVTGTGTIARVILFANQIGFAKIGFTAPSDLRNPANQSISFSEKVSGIVEIR